MIKTTELMLGNLIEFGGSYMVVTALNNEKITCGTVCERAEHFNPIPLTEGAAKRLGANYKAYVNSVHELQNNITLMNCKPIDITPLLSPRYTTHDGVEVWDEDTIYYYSDKLKRIDTMVLQVSNISKDILFFSSKQACQSYIDSVTRKPIFTTENGVDVFEGDAYWVFKYPYNIENKPDIIRREATIDVWKNNDFLYFSTEKLAQAYLNKVWAEAEYQSLLNTKK